MKTSYGLLLLDRNLWAFLQLVVFPKVESDCSLKANNEARLVERKVCFILEVSNQWGRVDFCPKVNSPWLATSGQELLQMGGGGLFTETVQSALTVILKLVMQWSDQCHLDCLNYSSSIFSSRINFFLFLWGQPSEFWQLNRLVPNRKRSVSRLYIVTLLI